MELVRIAGLSGDPLAAAATFLGEWSARLAAAPGEGDLLLIFPVADHAHHGWRLAAVQMLARRLAPRRINAVASDSEAAIAAAATYLANAPGLTGQVLGLDPTGAAAPR
jgi:hypothetical protein